MADVTQLLNAIDAGDPQAIDQLLPEVYDELRRLAAAQMAREKPGQTLNATALVHEAYMRLVKGNPGANASGSPNAQGTPSFANRRYFFAAAAEAMRRLLIEAARRKQCKRHGGGWQRANIDLTVVADADTDSDLLALDQALHKFAAAEPDKAQLIQLRYFAGMTNDEAAELLGISPATAKRYWRYARAWLHREIAGQEELDSKQ